MSLIRQTMIVAAMSRRKDGTSMHLVVPYQALPVGFSHIGTHHIQTATTVLVALQGYKASWVPCIFTAEMDLPRSGIMKVGQGLVLYSDHA